MSGSKKLRITGWVLSVLIALFLIGASAMGKFTQWEGKGEMFAKMGWTEDVMFKIGVVEVAIAILFLIPAHRIRRGDPACSLLGRCYRNTCSFGRAVLLPHHCRNCRMDRTRTS